MPEEQDPIRSAQQATGAIGELIKIAGGSPEGRIAGKNIGKTAIVITETINNCLLPIAALNFGINKARKYFEKKFFTDIEPLISEIPTGRMVEPKASLAAPALQGLAFSHEEEDLKKFYLKLIAGAMDSDTADRAHPAYVEVIKQLTAYEARALEKLVKRPMSEYPVVKIKKTLANGTSRMFKNVIDWRSIDPEQENPTDASVSMMDNWIRLGLISVDFTSWYTHKGAYDWAESCIPYKRLVQMDPVGPAELVHGSMSVTSFGRCFGEAVGIRLRPTSLNVAAQPTS